MKQRSTAVTLIPVRTLAVAMTMVTSLFAPAPPVTMVTGARRVMTSARAWIPVRMGPLV